MLSSVGRAVGAAPPGAWGAAVGPPVTVPAAAPRVVLIDSEPLVCGALSRVMARRGLAVDCAGTIAAAQQLLLGGPPPALVISELALRCPDGLVERHAGLALLRSLRPRLRPAPPWVVLTGAPTVPIALLRAAGAAQVLMKPLAPSRLFAAISACGLRLAVPPRAPLPPVPADPPASG